MPSYKIERWDPVIPTGHTQPLPMIYIKPDETLVKLAEDNFYTVIVEISGTGKLYDTKPMVGIIDSSGYYPQFRPNFFNDKKLLVITLMCDWIGYGDLGAACIHGFTGPDKVKFEPKKFEPPKPLPEYEGYKKPRKNNLSNRQLALILGVIIFILCGIGLVKLLKANDSS
jgi:hypothetical protein